MRRTSCHGRTKCPGTAGPQRHIYLSTRREAGADHVLAVKRNQGTLHQEVKAAFDAERGTFAPEAQDRCERRTCTALGGPGLCEWVAGPEAWSGSALCATISPAGRWMRRPCRNSSAATGASRTACTSPWMPFRKDDCRMRKGHAPAVMGILRRAALNLLRMLQQNSCAHVSIGLLRDCIGRQPWILAAPCPESDFAFTLPESHTRHAQPVDRLENSDMFTNHCALCDEIITPDTDSREHVIPQAIGGGNCVVSGFLCSVCNSKSGEEWDAVLAKQLAPWSLLFDVKRSRKSIPPQKFETLHGGPVKVHAEGFQQIQATPKVEKTEQGYHIQAPNLKVARQLLEGLKAKHSEQSWDVEQQLADANLTAPFNDLWKIPMSIGGSQAGRSIVKSALALTFHAGIAPGDCEEACAYLRHEGGPPCFDYYYLPDIVENRETGTPIHCVHVRANPNLQTLMAYIELFGLYRMVACLSRKYTGSELTKTFAINPVTGDKVQLEINWHEELEQPLPQATKKVLLQYIGEVWTPIVDAAQEAWDRRAMSYEIERAMKVAVRNSGKKEGDPMTEDECKQIAKDVVHQLKPWLVGQFLNRNPNTPKGIFQIGDDPQFDPRALLESYYQSLDS